FSWKMVMVEWVVARTLETLIRLSTAHAKCHLREKVDVEDVKSAMAVLHYSLYQEVRSPPAICIIASKCFRSSEIDVNDVVAVSADGDEWGRRCADCTCIRSIALWYQWK